MENEILNRATNSEKLSIRANINDRYSKKDFNAWTKNIVNSITFKNVLDVCCGTGNQLIHFVEKKDVNEVIGVDISKESLIKAGKRLEEINSFDRKKVKLKQLKMEEMFNDSELSNMKFDLISCFYGLYYSQNVEKSIKEMIGHLNSKGKLLIVGPYGENNFNFFNIIEKYFKIPNSVIRGSSTFMHEEVLPIIKKHGNVNTIEFTNEISYPTVESILDYWKASTFYCEDYKKQVEQDIEKHFSKNNEFILQKHIKAYILTKN